MRLPADIKADYPHASIVGNGRIVFNIKGNTYRLIVLLIAFAKGRMFIRFVGTHAEYDKIDASTILIASEAMTTKPIRTKEDYEAALAEIDALWNVEPETPEADRFEVLMTLVEAYEEEHYEIPPPDPIEMIMHVMDARGLARRDLEPYIGTRARVSEILNRRRPLTLNMIRNLHEGLGIPADVLVQPYDLQDAEPVV